MAVKYLQAGANRAVDSFTAHGSYVLYQTAFNSIGHGAETTPELLILACLDRQMKLIDQFVPTDPANLSSLPVDPSGRILAATLVRDGAKLPFNAGVWERAGWLHSRSTRPRRQPHSNQPAWTMSPNGWRPSTKPRMSMPRSA
jgi:hypothetical protein